MDSEGVVGWATSIALDSEDNVHISYKDSTNSCLKYATDEGGGWANVTIDDDGGIFLRRLGRAYRRGHSA